LPRNFKDSGVAINPGHTIHPDVLSAIVERHVPSEVDDGALGRVVCGKAIITENKPEMDAVLTMLPLVLVRCGMALQLA
jgi:hypothetical protein